MTIPTMGQIDDFSDPKPKRKYRGTARAEDVRLTEKGGTFGYQLQHLIFTPGEVIELSQMSVGVAGSKEEMDNVGNRPTRFDPFEKATVLGNHDQWIQVDFGPRKGGGRKLECIYKADLVSGRVRLRREGAVKEDELL